MIDLLNALLIGFAILISLPAVILSIEILAAFLPGKKDNLPEDSRRPSIAILVPAHDEAAVIASTLSALKLQLGENDRLLVVADNCTDNTAEIARGLGAEVIERLDPENRGKGFALDFGVRHLEQNPPEVVIVIDADCLVSERAVETLALHASAKNRPVQALNLMYQPSEANQQQKIAEFAWIIKNLVRPLGLKHMGLPCQLMGTGMAFPWQNLMNTNLASGHIVEDMKLGLDLARQGFPPFFLPDVQVSSTFPLNPEAALVQRTRWEHGHLNTILSQAPKLLIKGLRTKNGALIALTCDMSVPPLGFYALVLLSTLLLAGLYLLAASSYWPFWLSATALILTSGSLGFAWMKFGRSILPVEALRAVFIYLFLKLPIYTRFVTRRETKWVRTDRD